LESEPKVRLRGLVQLRYMSWDLSKPILIFRFNLQEEKELYKVAPQFKGGFEVPDTLMQLEMIK